MRTYHGLLVRDGRGAPTIEDIAIMQGRICRFNGATQFYWPVLLHSLSVADLFPADNYLATCALLHDAAEVIISDIPRTIKPSYYSDIERRYLKNIYSSLSVPWPSRKHRKEISAADNAIGWAECRLFGPVNINLDFPNEEVPINDSAECIVGSYIDYCFEDVLNPSGKYVQLYIQRLKGCLAKSM